MLSVAPVGSASGAAGYFAADNYYAGSDGDRSGEGNGWAKVRRHWVWTVRSMRRCLKPYSPASCQMASGWGQLTGTAPVSI